VDRDAPSPESRKRSFVSPLSLLHAIHDPEVYCN
jgi:hypothetical protein